MRARLPLVAPGGLEGRASRNHHPSTHKVAMALVGGRRARAVANGLSHSVLKFTDFMMGEVSMHGYLIAMK